MVIMRDLIKQNVFSAFFIIFTLFNGCEERLDLEPQQGLSFEAAFSTDENVQNILVGNYAEASQQASYGGYLNLASELLANTGELIWQGTFFAPREFNNKEISTTNFWVEIAWLNGFEVSNQSNMVIANKDKFSETSEQDRVEGESKFLRGLVYFDLARFFGAPYEAGQTNSQLGVPIMLDAVTDASQITKPARNTVEEVYAQVLQDLKDAYNLLPADNGIFADKYAAQSLLARVYLQQGNFEAARNAADDVINNSGHILENTFASAFNNDNDSNEDIFSWQITSQDGVNGMNRFWANGTSGGRGDVTVTKMYLDLFTDSDDRAIFFYDVGFSTKWQSQFANIPFIRLAEMYLIRAECNQRLGTAVGATPQDDINTIRNRANAPVIAVDLDVILLERRKELGFEGHRLHDIKRLKESIGEIDYDADNIVFPIPQREMDVNSNLEQNPGYGN
jgi:tetratricopeptide (TPR) repeat protein